MGGIADYSGSLVLQMPTAEACLVAMQRQGAGVDAGEALAEMVEQAPDLHLPATDCISRREIAPPLSRQHLTPPDCISPREIAPLAASSRSLRPQAIATPLAAPARDLQTPPPRRRAVLAIASWRSGCTPPPPRSAPPRRRRRRRAAGAARRCGSSAWAPTATTAARCGQLVGNGCLPCLRTAPHPPAWWLQGLRPLGYTPERRLRT